MADPRCSGVHRYFVADRAMVPHEGKVVILLACLQCGNPLRHDHQVASPGTQFSRIENEKEETQ